jgi:hypothetical protein
MDSSSSTMRMLRSCFSVFACALVEAGALVVGVPLRTCDIRFELRFQAVGRLVRVFLCAFRF